MFLQSIHDSAQVAADVVRNGSRICGWISKSLTAIAVRHFGAIEHLGNHSEWIGLNANAARALNFWLDASRTLGWTDGADFIWTVRWVNGHPIIPPSQGEQSDGWLLLGTPGVAAKLADSFESVRRLCVVQRRLADRDDGEESGAQWDEPFPM